MSKKLFIIIYILINTFLSAQEFSNYYLVENNKETEIKGFVRNELTYLSAKDLAAALNSNFFYNETTNKIELKFSNYNLRITAKNQFIVLVDKVKSNNEVLQIPISTFLIANDIYLPYFYLRPIMEKASERKINIRIGEKLTESLEATKEDNLENTKSSNFDIFDLEIDEKTNGTLIRLKSSKKINNFRSSINKNILYVFPTGVTIDEALSNPNINRGILKSVRVRNISGNYQIEFELGPEYTKHDVFTEPGSNDILIAVHNQLLTSDNIDINKNKEKWQFDVVVIDPGHGGKDPGAVGVGGIKEKDINLAIALKLGNKIKQTFPDLQVVYTRNDDRFIELYRRGKIANENDGKLFISIHCNSIPKKSRDRRGFEVYLLRPGRTEEAIQIAEIENSVIKYEDDPSSYQKLTDENFILVSMAHSSYMRYSEHFAEILVNKFSNTLPIPSGGVKQAGFYVLVGASMPSVLIEAGFLSNAEDAKYLNSSDGQEKIASAILDSLRDFKLYYNTTMKEGNN